MSGRKRQAFESVLVALKKHGVSSATFSGENLTEVAFWNPETRQKVEESKVLGKVLNTPSPAELELRTEAEQQMERLEKRIKEAKSPEEATYYEQMLSQVKADDVLMWSSD